MKHLKILISLAAITIFFSTLDKASAECRNLRYWGCFCKDTENKNPPPHEFTQLPGADTTFCADGKNNLEFSKAIDDYTKKCGEAAKSKPNLSDCKGSGRARTAKECDDNPFPGCKADQPQNPPKINVYPPADGIAH